MASRKIFQDLLYAFFFIRLLFNLELPGTCEFLKKLKLHEPKRLEQFQLVEKLTRANFFQIGLETVTYTIVHKETTTERNCSSNL